MSSEPFFLSQGEQFIPQPICRGPWGPETLHGRVVAGLLSYEIERKWLQPGFLPSRLTVDLYRMPKFAPCTVESRVVRDGNRIRIVDAEFFNDGVSVGRASCVMLRKGESPAGRVWGPEPSSPVQPWWPARPS